MTFCVLALIERYLSLEDQQWFHYIRVFAASTTGLTLIDRLSVSTASRRSRSSMYWVRGDAANPTSGIRTVTTRFRCDPIYCRLISLRYHLLPLQTFRHGCRCSHEQLTYLAPPKQHSSDHIQHKAKRARRSATGHVRCSISPRGCSRSGSG
jgi:hypothetical protein